MKTSKITLNGREYPLCFSTWAIKQLCAKFGSMQGMSEAMKAGAADTAGTLDSTMYILQVLIDAGVRYAAISDGTPPVTAPSMDELEVVCGMDDLPQVQRAIADVIRADSETTVNVAPEKNTEAATAN